MANSEPTVANPIADQTAIVQAPFNYSIANTFSDADNDPLYYTATLADGSPLPGWLHFDSYSRSLTGTPGAGDTGTISVKVLAFDSALAIGSAFNTSGGPLYYSATLANGNPLPYWLQFDSYTGSFHSTDNN
ncbi:MAG: putative Ig domain-containing protein [Oscillatoria princeps RMCB-10]|nr:putative Ig domain-containing protein [Oscillatoria princeps RMCB-10]